MRYASIRDLDISNGEGIGVALFVQGCKFHCKNCFNQVTWDFQGGKEFTQQVREGFLKLIQRPFIQRVSILGGEPLEDENYRDVIDLLKTIDNVEKWVYTGYRKEELMYFGKHEVFKYADVIVDGRYIDELRDLNLKFRGSSNQSILRKGVDF